MARQFEHDRRRGKEREKRLEGGRRHRSPNPVTPLPRRASASSPGLMKVRSRYTSIEFQEDDVTCLPPVSPSAIWQGEVGEDDICELTTNPPPLQFQPRSMLALRNEPAYIDAVVEADTIMDDTLIVVPVLPSDIDRYPTRIEDAALAVRAEQLLSSTYFQKERPAFISNPLDYTRGWLLRPGRLEFLCWLGSAILLSICMCAFLVVLGLRLGWVSFGHGMH